ncbi:MAG: hypothetical protein ABI452_06075 [Candidatus Limnocylindrales bacterium]
MRKAYMLLVAVVIGGCTSVAAPPTSPVTTPSPILIYVTPAPTPSPVIIYVTPAPTATPVPTAPPTPIPTRPPTPKPTATPIPTFNPADYTALTSREWSQLIKSPWDRAFETHIVWGCITQFDSATGPDAFRAQASYRNEDYWYSDGENSYFEANGLAPAGMLDDFFEDDVVLMYVVTSGDYSYDTTLGGTVTVPLFSVTGIEHKGSC